MTDTATVLVVDDTPANIRLLEAILSTHDYAVRSAATGQEALDAIAADSPDLVLLDIQMPGMNGYEVCRRIREDERTAMLPVIMITASGHEEKLAALEAGADDFVLRPFDQAELLARVRSLLRIKAYHDTVVGQAAELAAWNRVLEEEVRERLEEVQHLHGLRRFLSAHVAEVVLSSGEETLLEPHRREVAILFCDLRGFTAFSASSEPEESLGALQGFHRILGDLVAKHGATVGFFAGDGVMLFFNDPMPTPEPALRAIQLAIELRDAMSEYAVEWHRRGHEIGVGMAVSFGFATLGMLGFEGRYDYSVIGPVVNLASRLCDRARNGEILVSQRACAVLEDRVDMENRGEVELHGFPNPVAVWAVSGMNRQVQVRAVDRAGDIDIRVLGPLELRCGDQTIDLRASKERALLTVLVINRGRVVSVDRLADDLWDGSPPDSATGGLRVHVSRLRKSLAACGVDSVLVTRPPGYLLDVDDGSVDAVRFERLAAEGRRSLDDGDATAAVDRFRTALDLWRGPAFVDVAAAPFAAAEAARLEESRLVVVEDCIEAELASGRHRQVLGELEALVLAHPLRERLWAHRMVALYRSGRQPEALTVYQDLRRLLSDEMGLEPSAELNRLHQAILTQSPDLDLAAAVGD